jgi:hypothetical protein
MTDTPNPPVLTDLQDPLPESNWLWRRVLTFMAMTIIFLMMAGLGYAVHRIVGGVIERIDGMTANEVAAITIKALGVIERMFGWMYWSLLVVVTYYMVAPSAEQIAKMISAVSLLKGGVKTASRTLVDAERGTVERSTATGRPEIPDLPAAQADSEAPGPETPAEPSDPPWGRT